ncbi:uncharacterized protein EI97DRAFT_273877 [Westerdykella ornata]|uniref:Uncharacterized protein n=1 Tax=Westerdykella ornata TaxID=318751 RepID=A0A6A6JQ45_WESOR|nr:uncharacterized protein EI97DRAFT_273877 [Westerdykella ornata]KAF2277806.1 hypothetical protein EI97DRAFT_273877 [Westerdykella ornata]
MRETIKGTLDEIPFSFWIQRIQHPWTLKGSHIATTAGRMRRMASILRVSESKPCNQNLMDDNVVFHVLHKRLQKICDLTLAHEAIFTIGTVEARLQFAISEASRRISKFMSLSGQRASTMGFLQSFYVHFSSSCNRPYFVLHVEISSTGAGLPP